MLVMTMVMVMMVNVVELSTMALLSDAACTSNLDCELLGNCTNGLCVCYKGFTGPSCGQLDLLPVSSATRGRVWPVSTAPYAKNNATWDPTSIGWSFAPVYDPVTRRYIAAVETVCDKWGSDVWLAAVSSSSPDSGWRFERRLGPAGTNCPHMKRLTNGTFALILNAMADGVYPANETKDPGSPICVGDTVSSPEKMVPVLRPCGPDEAPSLGHNCLCSRASLHCPDVTNSVYVVTTDNWPDGPWRVAPVTISGPGWSPYNATIRSIGTSNPTIVQLADGRSLISFRSHRGYWPEIERQLNSSYGSGEHIGFALSGSIEGPFDVSGNLSWQYGNDEDPFVWQQPDGTMHCLYHNGRSIHTNHGLHAFSVDGRTWHKASDALLSPCASNNPLPKQHNCSAMYTDLVKLDNGSSITLNGRERPALLFDESGTPVALYNGAIDVNPNVPWYAMAQLIDRD